jgi:DNA-binding XRE family transcriptional regulator
MYQNLEQAMNRKHITHKMLAAILGVSSKTLQNKMQGRTDFTLPEVQTILELFPQYKLSYLFEKSEAA